MVQIESNRTSSSKALNKNALPQRQTHIHSKCRFAIRLIVCILWPHIRPSVTCMRNVCTHNFAYTPGPRLIECDAGKINIYPGFPVCDFHSKTIFSIVWYTQNTFPKNTYKHLKSVALGHVVCSEVHVRFWNSALGCNRGTNVYRSAQIKRKSKHSNRSKQQPVCMSAVHFRDRIFVTFAHLIANCFYSAIVLCTFWRRLWDVGRRCSVCYQVKREIEAS